MFWQGFELSFFVWNNVDMTSPFDARTAHLDFVELRAALCGFCAISLSFHKEMAKEKELRGKPLRTPERATKS